MQAGKIAAQALAKLRTRLQVVGKSVLADQDQDLVREALVMRYALLLDLTAGSPNRDDIAASWKRTILGLTTLDVELYAQDWKTCREICTSLDVRVHYPDTEACTRAFKQLAQGRIHYKWILSITLKLMEGDDWFWRVNQFVVFDSKLNLESLDLTTSAYADYIDFEKSLPERGDFRHPDGKGETVVAIARRAARDLVGDFVITDYPFRPRHGNGATREVPRSKADAWHKNRQFAVDSEVITYLRYRVPESDWHDWFYCPYRGLDRTAVVRCVPKSMVSNRTISEEPTTLQYLQQDVHLALDDYIQERLADKIDIHNQSRSRFLAQVGSSDGSYATIDLSSASDSVSCDLVDLLLGDLPIAYPLFATRSTHVILTDRRGGHGTRIRTHKFAPMGSATCFDTETLVFTILCETAIRHQTNRHSKFGDFRVYGDDIVIRNEYASTLVWILEFFGFTINKDKSFYGDDQVVLDGRPVEPAFFREACGIECLNGEDVTPLRLSRRLVSCTNNDSNHLAGQGVGMIDLVNRAYLYRYPVLRATIVSWLTRYKWFRTCQYLSISHYREFVHAIEEGREPGVWVNAPFVITDDACDTNWRAFDSRYDMSGLQEPEALLATVVAGGKALPETRDPRTPYSFNSEASGKKQTRLDGNDLFTWMLHTVARTDAEVKYSLDATGIATIRTQDLRWSYRKWVVLPRAARPTWKK